MSQTTQSHAVGERVLMWLPFLSVAAVAGGLVFAFFGMASGLLTVGVGLGLAIAIKGHRWDPPRGRWRCPKCWYDMSGAVVAVCPECGRSIRTPEELTRTRHSRSVRWVGVLIAFLCIGWGSWGYIREHRWQMLPISILVRIADRSDPAWEELLRRASQHGFSMSPSLARLAGAAAVTRANNPLHVRSMGSIIETRFFWQLQVGDRLQVWSCVHFLRNATYDRTVLRSRVERIIANDVEEAERLLASWESDPDPGKGFIARIWLGPR